MAGEKHFANYYAFAYARRLVGLAEEEEVERKWRGWVMMVKTWCLAHPRDISGWGLLWFLLRRDGQSEELQEVVGEVEECAKKFGWKGQGVKWFLEAVGRIDGDEVENTKGSESSSVRDTVSIRL